MDNNSAVTSSVLAMIFIIYGLILVAVVAFSVWIYWRILAKAGYNGALALLNLVPGIGQFVCIIILAFGRWPIEDEIASLRASVVPTNLPPASPPGLPPSSPSSPQPGLPPSSPPPGLPPSSPPPGSVTPVS